MADLNNLIVRGQTRLLNKLNASDAEISGTLKASTINSANVVKSLSISGKTITVTKGDGTTSALTTQDTNTTYTGDSSTITLSGTTFSQKSGIVTAGSAGPTANVSGSNGATIKVPRITVDTYGRVTGLTEYTLTNVNTDTNTDTKVTQTVTTSNASYPLLLAPNGQTATSTTTAYFDSGVTLNPSNNVINANISGTAYALNAKSGSSAVPGKAADGTLEYYYNVNNGLTNNMPTTNNANGILNISRHGGEYPTQIGFSSDDNIYYRNGVGTTAWKKVLDSSNYNNYAPSKTGSGASGTWAINISGKATTAGTADSANAVAWGNVSSKPSTFTPPTATSSTLGGVKVGSNITVSSGTISLSKANVTSALGYTPPQRLVFTNKTVATSAWVSDSTYSDFPYKASISCSGVTSNHLAEVIFGLTDVISGIFAPINQTATNVVYIWASEKPSATITIPTISCLYN